MTIDKLGGSSAAAAALQAKRQAEGDYRRQPRKLEEGTPNVEAERGDTVWALAAQDLGGKASGPQVQKRVDEYRKLNPELNLDKIIPGDQLRLPPPTAWQTAQAAAQARPASPEQAAAATAQTEASAAATKAERERAGAALKKNVDTVAAGADKPMTDTQRSGVADMAKDLFAQADKLGIGDEVKGSAAGKKLQGVIDEVKKGQLSKSLDSLAAGVADTLNNQPQGLTDGQTQAVAEKAAPLLAQAKELGLSSPATKQLEAIVQTQQKTDVTKATAALSQQVGETLNSQPQDLTAGQRQAFAEQAAPLLAKAKELGVSTDATKQLQGVVDAHKTTLSQAADALVKETRNTAQSGLTPGQKQAIAEKAAPLLAQTRAFGVSTEATTQLKGVVDEARAAVSQAAAGLVNDAIATQNKQGAGLNDEQRRGLAERAAPLLKDAKALGLSTDATRALETVVNDVTPAAPRPAQLKENLAMLAQRLPLAVGPKAPPLTAEQRALALKTIEAAAGNPALANDAGVKGDIAMLKESLAYDAVKAADLKYSSMPTEQLSAQDLTAIGDALREAKELKVGDPAAMAQLAKVLSRVSEAP